MSFLTTARKSREEGSPSNFTPVVKILNGEVADLLVQDPPPPEGQKGFKQGSAISQIYALTNGQWDILNWIPLVSPVEYIILKQSLEEGTGFSVSHECSNHVAT